MSPEQICLAVDIGASSGRHVAGWKENGEIRTEELFRFPNAPLARDGSLVWDTEALFAHVKAGVDLALEKFPRIASLSIDTWGVDYVLLRDGEPVSPCYAYRDHRTVAAAEAVHRIIPFEELYRRTGIQFQPFNSIYQWYDDLQKGRLNGATDILMMPEYLSWRLSGSRAREYTMATTTGLVNAEKGCYDREILQILGLPEELFPALSRPGKILGEYRGIPVILGATHDTAAAVEGIPLREGELFLSSGTWSLLGTRTSRVIATEESRKANLTNEGGVGYVRFLKNIMGMWLVNRLREELCPGMPFDEITLSAEESRYDETADVDDPVFLSPERMTGAFDSVLRLKPETSGDYFRCAYRSLALSYGRAVRRIEHCTGEKAEAVVIVGGGAKNAFLNRLTQEACSRPVRALPIEATALGNLKVQMNSLPSKTPKERI